MLSLYNECTGRVKFFSMSSKPLSMAPGKLPNTWSVMWRNEENNLHLEFSEWASVPWCYGEFLSLFSFLSHSLKIDIVPFFWKELCDAHAFGVKEDANKIPLKLIPFWRDNCLGRGNTGQHSTKACKQYQMQNEGVLLWFMFLSRSLENVFFKFTLFFLMVMLMF